MGSAVSGSELSSGGHNCRSRSIGAVVLEEESGRACTCVRRGKADLPGKARISNDRCGLIVLAGIENGSSAADNRRTVCRVREADMWAYVVIVPVVRVLADA